MSNVKVKLAGDCYAGGVQREKGEIVELDSKIAADFGEIVKEPTQPVQGNQPGSQQTQGSQQPK